MADPTQDPQELPNPTLADRHTIVIAKDGETPYMRPPQGGRLKIGNPGNKGGTGKPKDAIRAELRNGVERALPTLQAIASGEESGDKLRAIEIMLRYGVGTSDETENTIKDQRAMTADERRAAVLALVKPDSQKAG